MVGGAGDDLRQGNAAAAADQGAVDGLGSRAGLARRVSGPQSINHDKPCGLTSNAASSHENMAILVDCVNARFRGPGVEKLGTPTAHSVALDQNDPGQIMRPPPLSGDRARSVGLFFIALFPCPGCFQLGLGFFQLGFGFVQCGTKPTQFALCCFQLR